MPNYHLFTYEKSSSATISIDFNRSNTSFSSMVVFLNEPNKSQRICL